MLLVAHVDLVEVAVELDSWIHLDADGIFSIDVARAGSTISGKGRLDAEGRISYARTSRNNGHIRIRSGTTESLLRCFAIN
jgi:hypothetical protein